jgi:hypothetical protein
MADQALWYWQRIHPDVYGDDHERRTARLGRIRRAILQYFAVLRFNAPYGPARSGRELLDDFEDSIHLSAQYALHGDTGGPALEHLQARYRWYYEVFGHDDDAPLPPAQGNQEQPGDAEEEPAPDGDERQEEAAPGRRGTGPRRERPTGG